MSGTKDPLTPYRDLRAALSTGLAPIPGSWVALSDAMDGAVLELTEPGRGMAVVATGGYGRRQLCVHSDIDLMLVVETNIKTVPPVFRALWDEGLSVGHAVRTPRAAYEGAVERPDTLCSLLEARLIGGDADVFEELRAAVRKATRLGRLRDVLAAEERQRRRDEPHHLQAVNLKTGRGGLRALQALRWLRIAEEGGVADEPIATLEASHLTSRQALHIAAGRAHDCLDFALRKPAADAARRPIADFMRDVFGTARAADTLVAEVFGDRVSETGMNGVGGRLFQAVRSRLRQRAPDTSHPWQIAADAAQRGPGGLALTPDERTALDRFGGTMWDETGREAFVRLAGAGSAGRRVFDELAAAEFLSVALPEWAHVVSQPQLDPFHLHPVDDHLWRTAAEVVRLASPDSDEAWARDIAEELGSLDELVLGSLFHDIGKGTGRDHSLAGAELFDVFGRRAGFSDVTVDVVGLLIRHHLLLPQVATRHDLDDPGVIGGVADVVRDADVLRMLYLLTIADARATGPDVWTPWRASLIRTLFARAMDAIESDRPRATPLRAGRIAEVTEVLAEEIPADRIAEHLAAMPETYALRTSAGEVRRHLLLLEPAPAADEVRVDVVDSGDWTDAVLVTRDRAGLLSIVSGVMALSNVSIVEARLATRGDGVVVDRFNVVDSLRGGAVESARWTRILADLRSALMGEFSLEERLADKHLDYQALVDASIEPVASITAGADHGTHRIELRGADRVGLLHDVAEVMRDFGVDVRFAKIDTQGDRVIDTFHVEVPDGVDHAMLVEHLRSAARVPG